MGQHVLTGKKVTLNDSTFFVLSCYESAKIAAGFQEGLDARLELPQALQKKGLTNYIKGTVGKFLMQENLGNEGHELLPIEINLIPKTEKFNDLYVSHWASVVENIPVSKTFNIMGKIEDKQIVSEKIESPHILIMHLCMRLFAFSLHEGEQDHAKIEKYYLFLKLFANELLKDADNSPLFSDRHHQVFDDVGMFLGDNHGTWLKELKDVLTSGALFQTHLSAFFTAESVLSNINKIIQIQLIAHINPDATKESVNNIYLTSSLETLESKLSDKLIKKLEHNKKDADRQNLTLYSDKANRHLAAIEFMKRDNAEKKKKNNTEIYDISKITNLYNLLKQTNDVRKITDCVSKFVKATGWIGILTGIIKLDKLQELLSNYLEIANFHLQTLSPKMSEKSKTILIKTGAVNLDKLEYRIITLVKDLVTLQNTQFLEWVRNEIKDNLLELKALQTEYNINIIDIPVKGEFAFLENITQQNLGNSGSTVIHNVKPHLRINENPAIQPPAVASKVALANNPKTEETKTQLGIVKKIGHTFKKKKPLPIPGSKISKVEQTPKNPKKKPVKFMTDDIEIELDETFMPKVDANAPSDPTVPVPSDTDKSSDLIKMSHIPKIEEFKNIKKNQYIIANNTIWYFDYEKASLENLELLDANPPNDLLNVFNLDDNRIATEQDLKLIVSLTGHTQVTKTSDILPIQEMTTRWKDALSIINSTDIFSPLYPILSRNKENKYVDKFYLGVKASDDLDLINILYDEEQNTLLYYAVSNKLEKLVDWLLFYGASVLQKNNKDICSLEIASPFTDTIGSSIFLKLINKAQKEVAPNYDDIVKHDVLLEFSTQVETELYKGLNTYHQQVLERNNNFMSALKIWLAKAFNADYTVQRNESQVKAYLALKDAELSRNYEQFMKILESFSEISNTEGSDLHKMFSEVKKRGLEIKEDGLKMGAYYKQLEAYTKDLAYAGKNIDWQLDQMQELINGYSKEKQELARQVGQLQIENKEQKEINATANAKIDEIKAESAEIKAEAAKNKDEASKNKLESDDKFAKQAAQIELLMAAMIQKPSQPAPKEPAGYSPGMFSS